MERREEELSFCLKDNHLFRDVNPSGKINMIYLLSTTLSPPKSIAIWKIDPEKYRCLKIYDTHPLFPPSCKSWVPTENTEGTPEEVIKEEIAYWDWDDKTGNGCRAKVISKEEAFTYLL